MAFPLFSFWFQLVIVKLEVVLFSDIHTVLKRNCIKVNLVQRDWHPLLMVKNLSFKSYASLRAF